MLTEHMKFDKLSGVIKEEISEYLKKHNEFHGSVEKAMVSWFKNEFDTWILSTSMHSDNNRKDVRLNVELALTVIDTIIDSDEDDFPAHELVGNVINISKGGLYFKSEVKLAISSIIKVNINLSTLDLSFDNVEALAMIVRSDKLDNTNYGIGLTFSSFYDTGKDSLEIFILKNLAYYFYA